MERDDGTAEDDPTESPTPPPGEGEQRARGDQSRRLANWLPSADIENANPPWLIEAGGTIGVRLGAVSLALAIGGVVAGWFRIQPLASLAIVSSLILIGIAMLLGIAYQAFVLQT